MATGLVLRVVVGVGAVHAGLAGVLEAAQHVAELRVVKVLFDDVLVK